MIKYDLMYLIPCLFAKNLEHKRVHQRTAAQCTCMRPTRNGVSFQKSNQDKMMGTFSGGFSAM